jgi:acetoin utilization deacetylase AcuC-like enzyme
MRKTGIVKDEKYLDHNPGSFHPESPKRLESIYAMLNEEGMADFFEWVVAQPCNREDLLRVHSSDYVDRVAATAGKGHTALDPDTATSRGSYEAAVRAAGGLCEAISAVVAGDLDNAFALVRPPGHHAETGRAMGFCLFNNVAVGARYAQEIHGLERVLVVDWDLHHGNGTQHTFEEDPTVLYYSTHQYPYYPGSGAHHQRGRDRGEGYTVNVPLSTGHGDAEYMAIYERILKPVALEFEPELVLVSAGFDIYENDPLGGMKVTPYGFAGLARIIMDIADTCCGGRMVVTLEGGYNVRGQSESVRAVIKEMAGVSETRAPSCVSDRETVRVQAAMDKVRAVHGEFWKGLNP